MMDYGQKYRLGQKTEAKIGEHDIVLKGRIVNIRSGEYAIDWGDFGIFHYSFKLIDEPNKVNNITVIEDNLPEELFVI